MKRISWLMAGLAAAFAVWSCNRGDIPEQNGPGDDDDPYAEEKVTLALDCTAAAFDGLTSGAGWKPDDAIGVYVASTGAPVRFKAGTVSDGVATATFSGKVKKADSYAAVYPYSRDYVIKDGTFTVDVPASQDAVAGSADASGTVAFGKVEDNKVSFVPVLSLLKFKLEAENVREVKIASTSEGTSLAGKASVAVADLTATVSEGVNSVALTAAFESGKTYFAAALPGKFALELTLTNAGGKQVVRKVETVVEAERGAVSDLGTFTVTAEEWNAGTEEPDDPSGPKSYVLNGKAEVEAFAAGKGEEKETVKDLTIKGRDVSHTVARLVMDRVAAVEGTFALDGCGTENESDWFDTEGFLNGMELKGSIVFKDILNIVNPSALAYYEKIGGDLVIENCPHFVMADWSRVFEKISEVGGDLVIKGCKPSGGFNGQFLKSLKRVGGNFDFEGNSNIWSFKDKGDVSLEYIGGDLILMDNPSLWSLLGFDKLTHIGGNVVVFNNNPKFPKTNSNVDGEDCIGYCVLKDYTVSGVLSASASVKLGSDSEPVDFASLNGCASGEDPAPGEPQDYTLAGHAAVRAFVDAGISKETVRNLTVTGSDVTETDIRDIDNRVSRITGTLMLANLGTSDSWVSTNEVMEHISIEGSIILKDIPAHINPNGFENMTAINGDLIVENCPGLRCSGGWMPFKSVTEVTGDVRISEQEEFNKDFLNKLEKVGGSFTIEKCRNCWDWKSETLREIGGDLNITDCLNWENFYGFHKLTKLGGNVKAYKSEGYAQNSDGGDKWFPGADWDMSGKKTGLVTFTVLKKKGIFSGECTSYLWRADDKGGVFWYDITWDEYQTAADAIIAAEEAD